jgi:hypothetical protein
MDRLLSSRRPRPMNSPTRTSATRPSRLVHYRTSATDRPTVGSSARHFNNPARDSCNPTGRARAGAGLVTSASVPAASMASATARRLEPRRDGDGPLHPRCFIDSRSPASPAVESCPEDPTLRAVKLRVYHNRAHAQVRLFLLPIGGSRSEAPTPHRSLVLVGCGAVAWALAGPGFGGGGPLLCASANN